MNQTQDPTRGRDDDSGVHEELQRAAGVQWHVDLADTVWEQATRERRRTSWSVGVGSAAAVAGAIVLSQLLGGGGQAPPQPQPAPQPSITSGAPTSTGVVTEDETSPSTSTGDPSGTGGPTTGTTSGPTVTSPVATPQSVGIPPGGVVLAFERAPGEENDAEGRGDLADYYGMWRLLPDLAEPSGSVAEVVGITEPVSMAISPNSDGPGDSLWFTIGDSCGKAVGRDATVDRTGAVTVKQTSGWRDCAPEWSMLLDVLTSGEMRLTVDGDRLTAAVPEAHPFVPDIFELPVSDGHTPIPLMDGVWGVVRMGEPLPVPYDDIYDTNRGVLIVRHPDWKPLDISHYQRDGVLYTTWCEDGYDDTWGTIDPDPLRETHTIDGLTAERARWTVTCPHGAIFHPEEWYVPDLDLSISSEGFDDQFAPFVRSLQFRPTPSFTGPWGELTKVTADGFRFIDNDTGKTITATMDAQTRCSSVSGEPVSCTDMLQELYGHVDGTSGVSVLLSDSGEVIAAGSTQPGG